MYLKSCFGGNVKHIKKGGVTTFPLRPYVDTLMSVADEHFRFKFMVAGRC